MALRILIWFPYLNSWGGVKLGKISFYHIIGYTGESDIATSLGSCRLQSANLEVKTPLALSDIRTTYAIERRFVENRRRSRPMGTFSDRTSMERNLFSVFTYEKLKQ